MPTARELLEQADALMRRNRARVVDTDVVGTDVDIPELTDAVPDAIVVPPAPTTLDQVPELTDAVEEIEIASIVELPEDRGAPSEWLRLDRELGPVAGETAAPTTSETETAPARAAIQPPDEPGVEPWGPWPIESRVEPAIETPVEAHAKLHGEVTAAVPPETAHEAHAEPRVEMSESFPTGLPVEAGAEPQVEVSESLPTESPVEAGAEPLLAVSEPFPTEPGVEATVAAPVGLQVEPPMPEIASASAPMLEGAAAPDAPALQRAATEPTQPTEGGAPVEVPDDDWARWQALAEEIRMQVLQRVDIFTDTGLREQLGAQLQPIVERASAEMVATINQQVGTLLRAYIAAAIEREIEKWRSGNP